ncbi:MAG: hypothetical protein UR94_C0043G0007 [Parcubacteria group bacterium GW2011_GWA2_36_10]|nr:MAG: hypothetical protein UR94_C0043G0007 [Parcubacteria group bacterium GW2011_GWA2_36_10]
MNCREFESTAVCTVSEILTRTDQILQRLNRLQNDTDWRGGFLCIADAFTGLPWLIFNIGEVEEDRWEKCLAYCQEKARRLAEHPNHLASAESRDEDKGQWGGAIRADGIIISFSGLPEMLDECLCLELAFYLDRLNFDDVITITQRSGNGKFDLELIS